MICRIHRAWLVRAAGANGRPGRLTSRHLKRCAACRRFNAALGRVDATLAAAHHAMVDDADPEQVSAIVASVRRRAAEQPARPTPTPAPHGWVFMRPIGVGLTAAVVLVAAVVGWRVLGISDSPPPAEEYRAEAAVIMALDMGVGWRPWDTLAERELERELDHLRNDLMRLAAPVRDYWVMLTPADPTLPDETP